MWKYLAVLGCIVFVASVHSAPQAPAPAEKPQPTQLEIMEYEYQYEVKDEEKQLFFDKSESADAAGKVTGKYSVWLPDGRLMTVDYSVDGDSGFVPKISFQDNANPLQG